MKSFYKQLFFSPITYILLCVVMGLFAFSYLFPQLLLAAKASIGMWLLIVGLDVFLMFATGGKVLGRREMADKLSNGDENEITIVVENDFRFKISVEVFDEIPEQFQIRDLVISGDVDPYQTLSKSYHLRPVERGEYEFGALNVIVSSPLKLVKRRYSFDQGFKVPVYPSYLQMRTYQLMAISNRLTDVGVKKIRRLGQASEFEQIKQYVRGDDFRTINWKATARTGKLMANQYMDERSQQVFCLVDKSRTMKMPFEGMALLDYAINASLVLSNIALFKHDRAGLITFSKHIDSFLPASGRPIQMNHIMEHLYRQETNYQESDYAKLYAVVKRQLNQRSLLLLFTNFESVSSLRRQLPYLQKMAKLHMLVVIFFENTELKDLLSSHPEKLEDIYIKATGEQFAFEKQQIVRELNQHGISSILTPPEHLTVNTLNKYLELKSRAII
ncbi:DUF58 domain-containing protein [Pontibacter sp. G13]|uniref:DUF58 domain-containing protein n=1 Tax=Pontibacter sp. G13 TaxID=3074898 RepID=UPI00288AC073|nr:DUF58 domain-containing protein [Pontibacter sp. G13]WNJ21375.1 DUF58 domain-containing protein [Pontibacter sp. G13]